MEDHLSRLEAKVEETIELIQALRRENSELKQGCTDLEQRLTDVEGERDRLQQQLGEAGENAARIEQYEEKRRLIEQKVGGLLEKLEAMG